MKIGDIRDDVCIFEDKDGIKQIYFCGDSFYGYYDVDEFEHFLQLLNQRLEELKDEMK